MIRNKLASLLADRNLKISRVANDTDLSRNTITSTAQNDTKMIQLDTINELCQYLSISPADFFEYLNFDLSSSASYVPASFKDTLGGFFSNAKVENITCDLFITQSYNQQSTGLRSRTFDLTVKQTSSVSLPIVGDSEGTEIHFEVMLGHLDDNEEFEKEEKDFNAVWSELTPGFNATISKDIMTTVSNEIRAGIDSQIDTSENDDVRKKSVDWSLTKFLFNFSFRNAFDSTHTDSNPLADDSSAKPIIEIQTDELPF